MSLQRKPTWLGSWTAAAALAVVLVSSCYDSVTSDRRAVSAAAPRWVAPAGTTFVIELVNPVDSNVPEAPFGAVVVGPIMAANGSTIVKNGARVAGRATGVPGPSGRGLRLDFDSIETIHGVAALSATFAARQQDPALSATDVQGPGIGYDAVIGQPPAAPAPAERPSAIGGGPPEEPVDEAVEPPAEPPLEREPRMVPTSGPPIQLRVGARLNLMLMQPLAAGRHRAE
jgi:hypothetical protein